MSTYLDTLLPSINFSRFAPLFVARGFSVERFERLQVTDGDGLISILMRAAEAEAARSGSEMSGNDQLDLGVSFKHALEDRLKR
jgi:hypothetical protein